MLITNRDVATTVKNLFQALEGMLSEKKVPYDQRLSRMQHKSAKKTYEEKKVPYDKPLLCNPVTARSDLMACWLCGKASSAGDQIRPSWQRDFAIAHHTNDVMSAALQNR